MLKSRAYLVWALEWRIGALEAPTAKVNARHTPICIRYPCTHIAHTHPLPLYTIDLRYKWDIPRFAEISGLFGVGLGVENRGLRGTYRQGKCTSHTHMHQKPMLSNSLHSPLALLQCMLQLRYTPDMPPTRAPKQVKKWPFSWVCKVCGM